jgi:L-seryl-tRNA(Ser) seleniumtransferase
MTLPNELRRFIPSVNALLSTEPVVAALLEYPRWALVQETRALVDEIREGVIPVVQEKDQLASWHKDLGETIAARARETSRYSLKRVINATGVVLHTNMGRALLAKPAIDHMINVASRYSNLELDLATGERGSRYDHVAALICELTGAEDAIVVNNNAAAVVLCLSELAKGREVVISRGELVEIGGSFRIPEIMELSGCTLKEVGATNRSHLRDYEEAVGEDTALLLKVHTSNYRVIGFTKEVTVPELVPLAKARGLPIMNDLGAGCLVDLRQFGLPHEPTVQEALQDGADLVTFSGDKLLGGPQIGVIAGNTKYIDRLKRHQLLRALRVDKLTLAALEATLRIYRDSKDPSEEIPGLRMLGIDAETLKGRAAALIDKLRDRVNPATKLRSVAGHSQVGAGSAPESGLDTYLVAITPHRDEVATVDAALRSMNPAILLRVYDGELLVDLRCVFPEEEEELLESLVAGLAK